jgi:hypothetical protein
MEQLEQRTVREKKKSIQGSYDAELGNARCGADTDRVRSTDIAYPYQVLRMYAMLLNLREKTATDEEAWQRSPISMV